MPTLDPQLRGREYWLGLEHLANTPEFAARFDDEFSGYNPDTMRDGVSRRSFLKLMGAALGLAGLTASGCRRWPEEEIRPFAHRPEGYKPGVAMHYATMAELGGVATGLLVKSYDGRPIKIEGNPLHPGSHGATEPWQQASVLDIYDPQRSRVPMEKVGDQTRQRSWDDFVVYLRPKLEALRSKQGEGLAILAEAASGPTMQRLREAFRKQYPKATWQTWEAIHRDTALEGSRLALGKAMRPVYHLDQAQVIISFEDDLLGQHPNRLNHARDWAKGRRSADQGQMNRLYVIEGNLSTTGSVADHRIALRPSQTALLLQQLAAELGVIPSAPKQAELSDTQRKAFSALLTDVKKHQGRYW
ncbi:MAG: TAT-variant-translocated molybdopterin oxidoreductase [Phycisphaerales bacterium]|nr:TAT-variant-translocated molybdopterin oxidoreductase [Phycisphaerales bacterium]